MLEKLGLELLKEYWEEILIAVVLAFCLYSVYQFGYSAANTHWVNKYNKDTDALNARITNLESTSRAEADKNAVKDQEVNSALVALVKQIPTIKPKDKKGNVLTCNGKQIQDIYLGQEFTDSWNALNAKGK